MAQLGTFFIMCTLAFAYKALCVSGVHFTSQDKSGDDNILTSDSDKPHIIIIVADDLGFNDVSFHGSDQIPTPNIDFLAYNGITLNNYYVSPICTPTRAALMTGRHPIHTGLQHGTIGGSAPYGLPLNETLLPQYLAKLGYRSHIVGKWHLGMFKDEYTPLQRGFESHYGYLLGRNDYFTHTYEHGWDTWGLDFRKDADLAWEYTGQYSTFLFRDEAVHIIENHNKSQPLFLYLPFQAVHSGNADGVNLQAPADYIAKFNYIENMQRRIYAAMMSALDDAVGVVYDSLKNKGMLSNSIILFTTDNGGPANGFDYNAANNFPLRGIKHTLWEGGVRGVGLLHSPLLKKQGYVSNKLLHVCDWLPTLLSAAGGSHLLQNGTTLDGVDAWDMLSTGGPAVRKEVLHNIDPKVDAAAIRIGDYKLLVGNVDLEHGQWYPPYQLKDDDSELHYLKFGSNFITWSKQANITSLHLREALESVYRSQWPPNILQRMSELYAFAKSSELYSGPYSKLDLSHLSNSNHSRKLDKHITQRDLTEMQNIAYRNVKKTAFEIQSSLLKPVKVDCGVKPANASTNCMPSKSPCLYHIPSDPCEYNNIAAWNSQTVDKLLARLSEYKSTMVPPGNKPNDPAANPKNHGGAWVPWR